MGLFGKKDEAALPPAAPAPAPAKPAAKGSQKNTSLATTYIGKNLNIKGNISGEGSIIILGSFEGKFHLDGHLKVAQGAEIKGNLRATNIYVNGKIDGEIAATEKVQLENTARMKGAIATPRIAFHEGAMFDGEIKMSDSNTQAFKPAAAGPAQAVKPVATGPAQAAKSGSPGQKQAPLAAAPKKKETVV